MGVNWPMTYTETDKIVGIYDYWVLEKKNKKAVRTIDATIVGCWLISHGQTVLIIGKLWRKGN